MISLSNLSLSKKSPHHSLIPLHPRKIFSGKDQDALKNVGLTCLAFPRQQSRPRLLAQEQKQIVLLASE